MVLNPSAALLTTGGAVVAGARSSAPFRQFCRPAARGHAFVVAVPFPFPLAPPPPLPPTPKRPLRENHRCWCPGPSKTMWCCSLAPQPSWPPGISLTDTACSASSPPARFAVGNPLWARPVPDPPLNRWLCARAVAKDVHHAAPFLSDAPPSVLRPATDTALVMSDLTRADIYQPLLCGREAWLGSNIRAFEYSDTMDHEEKYAPTTDSTL
ncbi:hypothetical protein DFH06DRAFT_1130924 [Mycena polygramma]|nr:hypothetical protein DFH06DRAFT_1130924 [Mycena polygramma]